MPAAIKPEIGKRYGDLTVVGVSPETKSKWIFACECGTKGFIAIHKNVRNGGTSSCGCARKKSNRKRFFKEIPAGKVFGELTVESFSRWIEREDGKDTARPAYNCRCSCTKTVEVIGKNLLNGNTTTCGHTKGRRDSLIGETFERLTVVALHHHDKGAGGSRYWTCKCSCPKGTEIVVSTRSLVSGNTKSCGCLKGETAVQNFRNEGHEAYALDPAYAERRSLVYLSEIGSAVDKIGIAFDMYQRGRSAEYTEVWWTRELTRAQCWAVEQVALDLTREYAPEKPYYTKVSGQGGVSEQRTGWVLDDVIQLMESLCDECEELDWQEFYAKYLSLAA